MKNSVSNLVISNIPAFSEANGALYVVEANKQISFEIKRVFLVSANQGNIRGDHAHISCSQFLVCISGSILVECSDGESDKDFHLDNPSKGLLIPPGIWSRQIYNINNSVLAVFCDYFFDPDDYIRDYDSFIGFRRNFINQNNDKK